MSSYFCHTYTTDIGWNFHGVRLEALTVISVANGRTADSYLPQNLLDLYEPLELARDSCSSGISMRYVYIVSGDGTEHKIHLPINGYDPRWKTVIEQYKNDASIKSFRIGGETIREGRLATLLSK